MRQKLHRLRSFHAPATRAVVLLCLVCFATWPKGAWAQLPPEPSPADWGLYSEGLCRQVDPARLGQGGPVGFTDYGGRWVVEPTLSNSGRFVSGVAYVDDPSPGGPDGYYIDFTGQRVGDETIRRIKAGLRKVEKDGKWGFAIEGTDDLVIEAKYEEAWDFSEGLALVRVEGSTDPRYRWIDYAGRERIAMPGLHDARSFHDGLAKVGVEIEGRGLGDPPMIVWGLIDRTGNYVAKPQFDELGDFHDGRAMVCTGFLQYGYIDCAGKIVIPAEFVGAKDFSEGLAAVMVRGPGEVSPWGFIDPTGKFVIPAKYWRIRSFSGGMAHVNDGTFKGFIDHAGKVVREGEIEIIGM